MAATRPERRWALMRRSDIPDLADSRRVYLSRWRVVETPLFGVFLHRIRLPDSDRYLHDHPWAFASMVLVGGYSEVRAAGLGAARSWAERRDLAAPGLALRSWRRWSCHVVRRSEFHAITAIEPGTWTLLLVGPRLARWGFATPDGFVDASETAGAASVV